VVDDAQYEFTSVQAIRGMEAKTIAKWERDGWEVDRRDQGVLRTELTFRRVKPKTFVSSMVAAFRGLEPKVQLLAVSVGALLLVLVVGVAVVAGVKSGRGSSQPAASATEADAGVSGGPSESQAPAAGSAVATRPAAGETLTVQNNAELAELMTITDPSLPAVGEFAAKYRGRTIAFDGNIAYMGKHGDYDTRYDLLINAGDYSLTSSVGPNFQFQDVNVVNDLHLTGANTPDAIGSGDNLRIVARVGDYNSTQELFFLEPLSTEVR
jgi:hypothetical protein